MKILNKYKYEYVCCLPQELTKIIMNEVIKTIKTLSLTDEEKQEAIKNAECEKLCNLTDTIIIEFV